MRWAYLLFFTLHLEIHFDIETRLLGNKPLTKPVLAKIIPHFMVAQGHNELYYYTPL